MIKQFFRMNLSLVKFLNQELRKIKNINQLVKFLLLIVRDYTKTCMNEYKNMFYYLDADYRARMLDQKKQIKIREEFRKTILFMKWLDESLDKAGNDRTTVRQFWQDFFKNGKVRKDTLDSIMKYYKL